MGGVKEQGIREILRACRKIKREMTKDGLLRVEMENQAECLPWGPKRENETVCRVRLFKGQSCLKRFHFL